MSRLNKIREDIQSGVLKAAHEISPMIEWAIPGDKKRSHVEKIQENRAKKPERGNDINF
jgi:hypothetical protein